MLFNVQSCVTVLLLKEEQEYLVQEERHINYSMIVQILMSDTVNHCTNELQYTCHMYIVQGTSCNMYIVQGTR